MRVTFEGDVIGPEISEIRCNRHKDFTTLFNRIRIINNVSMKFNNLGQKPTVPNM